MGTRNTPGVLVGVLPDPTKPGRAGDRSCAVSPSLVRTCAYTLTVLLGQRNEIKRRNAHHSTLNLGHHQSLSAPGTRDLTPR